jgi:hypothetical protein
MLGSCYSLQSTWIAADSWGSLAANPRLAGWHRRAVNPADDVCVDAPQLGLRRCLLLMVTLDAKFVEAGNVVVCNVRQNLELTQAMLRISFT